MLFDEKEKIEREIKKKILTYILGALGLVAALAWNDAIKGLIEYFYPQENNTVAAKLVYALIITIVVILSSLIANKILKNKKQK